MRGWWGALPRSIMGDGCGPGVELVGGVGEAEACCLSSVSQLAWVVGAVGVVGVGEQGEDFSGDVALEASDDLSA